MADIFLSYAREDETRARTLAGALGTRGWSIFWDRRIPHGRNFRKHIDDQLDSARCIVVLWSKASLVSQFVLDEATEGLNDGRLVPALIEAVRQPLGFRGLQAANLADWSGAETPHDEFDRLVSSIGEIVQPPPPAVPSSPEVGAPTSPIRSEPDLGLSTTWNSQDAIDLYDISRWGQGYFSVNHAGNLQVQPTRDQAHAIDLKELVDRLQLRGISPPVLIRFSDVVKHRLGNIHAAFKAAISQHQYQGGFNWVYPIKVNQQRQVVEDALNFGRPYEFGLEAGSKTELLEVLGLVDKDTLIICNGFKDAEFIETAMISQKIGRNIIPVLETYAELGLILEAAERIGVRPQIGMRVKLAARGSGRWQSSGGLRSKFGLTVSEIMRGLEELKARGMEDCFKLLRYHIGSQITNIRIVKGSLNEAARIYTELVKLGAGLRYIDVGGGLGVDYDGSQTNFESSVNYTLDEYANEVVYHIQAACDDAVVAHPTIVSESGRAVVAYHSVLVFNVLGVAGAGNETVPTTASPEWEQPLVDLVATHRGITAATALKGFHDAQQALDMALSLFNTGYLPLEQRAIAEDLYRAICTKLQRILPTMAAVPEDLRNLDEQLADTYFGNFSLFRSIRDSWAIKQLFPVMPIHRLNEKPTSHGVVGDINCSADGKLDNFIDRRDINRTLPLHSANHAPYYLGVFLVGAYQELLGDLHNLFGATHAVQVGLDENGRPRIDALTKGDTVDEVLRSVEFDPESLLGRLRSDMEMAVREARIKHEEAGRFLRFYEDVLQGYTYLKG